MSRRIILSGILLRVIFLVLSWYIYILGIFPRQARFGFFTDFTLHFGYWIEYAQWMSQGYLPYYDFFFEFPPLAAIIFLIPYLITPQYYSLCFGFLMIGFELVNLTIIQLIQYKFTSTNKLVLKLYAFLPPVIYFSISRFDPVMVTFLLLSIYFLFVRNRPIVATICLLVGIITKLFPIILLPGICIILYKREQMVELQKVLGTISITTLVMSLILLSDAALMSGLVDMSQFHLHRPIDNGAIIFLLTAPISYLVHGDWYYIASQLSWVQVVIQVIGFVVILVKLMKVERQHELHILAVSYLWAITSATVVNPQYFLAVLALFSVSNRSKTTYMVACLLTFHYLFIWGALLLDYPFKQVPSRSEPS